MSAVPALDLEGVSKHFDRVKALDRVSLSVGAGTIHSLLGANGSGKSTIVKILAGYHRPENGSVIRVEGRELALPVYPIEAGIAIVHQDLGLFESGTVLENVGVSSAYGARPGRPVSWRRERRRARAALARLGLDVSPDAAIASLDPAERTIVAIARALRQIEASDAEHPLLVLDEPTVTLAAAEVAQLFAVTRDLVRAGGAALFISHRLKEALAISDELTVLRDGRVAATARGSETSIEALIEAMHGREEVEAEARARERQTSTTAAEGKLVLRAEQLSGRTISGVSFSLGRGEVVGFTGLAGMGQDELPYLLVGERPLREGTVTLEDRPLSPLTPAESWRRGVAIVPADRARQSAWMAGKLSENFSITRLRSYCRGRHLVHARERRATDAAIRDYKVRAPHSEVAMATLSGGNQQKLVIARALSGRPAVLLLHEPFVGIDVAARAAVIDVIREAARDGCAIALFSIEYDLLASVCDRVAIISRGRVAAELTAEEASEAAISRAAQGALS